MKRLILIALVLSCCPAWAALFNCTTSGGTTTDFNTASTWTSCNSTFPKAPGADTYTYTITTGKNITCATGNTCEGGQGTTPGTADCFVNQGGTLTVAAGATLNCYALLEFQHGATLTASSTCGNIATINIVVPTSGVYGIQNASTGSGASNFTLTGAAPSSARCDVIINCNITGTGTCEYTGTSANVIENWAHVRWTNWGTASLAAVSMVPGTVQDITWTDVTFVNSGSITETRTGATVNWNFDGLNIINPLVGTNLLTLTDTTAQTGGVRQFNHIRVYNDTGSNYGQVLINVKSAIVGESVDAGDPADVEGIVCYNCTVIDSSANSTNVRINNSFLIDDIATSGTSPVIVLPDNGETFWNLITLGIFGNYHVLSSSGVSAGGGATVFNHNICDGDGTAQNDFGDLLVIIVASTNNMYRAMNLNNCGTTVTSDLGTDKVLNSLAYRAQGLSICETGSCANTALTEYHNNIMVWPLDQIGTNFNSGAYGSGDGLHFNQSYNSAAAQLAWGANTMGNNVYLMMPNSGDTLNGNTAESLSTANGGNANVVAAPYINTIKTTAGGLTGVVHVTSTAGTDTTHIFCSTCNFTTAAVQAGSEVTGFTGAPNPRSYVTVVNSATEVTLGIAIAGMTSGTTFSIGPSIYSNASFFLGDANNLQGDLHIDPSMRDPDNGTICNWLKANGQTVHCGTKAAGKFYNSTSGPMLITSVSGTTVVNCTSCDFVGWNIQVGEPIIIYSGTTTTARGKGTVTIVNSATQLTITSIASIATNDQLLFLDVTRGAGRALLTQAQYDQTGAWIAALPWATQMNARQYLDWRLTPMNGQLKNAAFATNCAADHTLCDIGPVPTYPPAILSF